MCYPVPGVYGSMAKMAAANLLLNLKEIQAYTISNRLHNKRFSLNWSKLAL